MDVHLLTYDLSRGLARQVSQSMLGFHLDAVYHTSIEYDGREWVYDGAIVTITPGSSHLGPPMERIHLGQTELPVDVVEEYVDSLREVFTVQSYDLFNNNCNNFSDSLAKFLVGKGIPTDIITMPQRVLTSPMGTMLYRQYGQAVGASARQQGSILGIGNASAQQHGPALDIENATAALTKPSHVHRGLAVPSFKSDASAVRYVEFAKVPPLDKLFAKLGPLAEEEVVQATRGFVETRAKDGAAEAIMPDLKRLAQVVGSEATSDSPDNKLFPLIDLLRCAMADPRVSGFYATDETPIHDIMSAVGEDAPYALRLVTLQMACNLFSSPLFLDKALLGHKDMRAGLVKQVANNLLDTKNIAARVAAASLALNMTLADRRVRESTTAQCGLLDEDEQAELVASLVEGISTETESPDAADAMLTALGHLVHGQAKDSEVVNLLTSLEAAGAVERHARSRSEKTRGVAADVKKMLGSFGG